MIFYLTLIFTILLPIEANALPTPDVLVSLVNIVPLLTGTVVTVAGGLYYGISRLLGPQGSKFFLGALLGFVILLLSVGYIWNQNRRAERTSQIAMYLRCDISSHNFSIEKYEANDPQAMDKWHQYGNFKKISMNQVAYMLRKQPDALLVATDDRVIRHYSGIPTVQVEGKLYPFAHIRPLELPAVLADTKSKDLYVTDFSYINRLPSFFKADKTIFKKFDNIYIVRDIKNFDRFVYDNSLLRPADKKNKVIDWPVEKERWILDEKAIYFPGIANLLTNSETSDLLEAEDVYLLAPYGSYRRNGRVQGLYLKRLLGGVDKKRVLSIDMTHRSTSHKLSEIVIFLVGARFFVVVFKKNDWLYEGLDATYELWRQLGYDSDRFRLVGFNTRLPEVIANRWEVSTRKNVIDILRDPFWEIVKWMHDKLSLSTGASLFLVAVILRLLLFPLGLLEACSRMKRAKIEYALKQEAKPLWAPSSKRLLKHLKVSSFWELLGAFIMLLLVLPAYRILSNFPEDIQNSSFLWVGNLTQPDYLLSLLVGGLILLKLRLGNSSPKLLTPLLVTVAFVLILFYLPSSLLVYVSGVLTITVLQDFIALRRVNKTLSCALLTRE
jgi:membrane protein insertase Oxa1/YidC/SpoIIIJ